MRIVVIGAGALGASLGARLARAGNAVTLVDAWAAHVDAINERGLLAHGVPEAVEIRLAAALPADAPTSQELALLAVDANSTKQAAALAARCLRSDGVAMTLQNGIGNVETLTATLGPERVVGGSTMCSFRTIGPGEVEQTSAAKTILGELDGATSERVLRLRDLMRAAGYPTEVSADIMATIWEKLVVNVSINPICAITGLRMGEMARLPATDRYQDYLLDEALAVARAKGLALPEADLRARIKAHCWDKYSKPSMLQHLEAGRQTEIEALNGALVREARALGVTVPFNEAIAMLIEGRQLHQQQRVQEPEIDYAALEAVAATEVRP